MPSWLSTPRSAEADEQEHPSPPGNRRGPCTCILGGSQCLYFQLFIKYEGVQAPQLSNCTLQAQIPQLTPRKATAMHQGRPGGV